MSDAPSPSSQPPSSHPPLNPTEGNPHQRPTQQHLTGRDRGFLAGRWFSLQAACAGLVHTLHTQPNAWIELTAVGVVSAVGGWFGLARWEWITLVLVFALILALEAVNTAVEAVVDLVSPDYHPLAKIAKDAAAGALVFAVLGSMVVAALIFGPRVWVVIRGW